MRISRTEASAPVLSPYSNTARIPKSLPCSSIPKISERCLPNRSSSHNVIPTQIRLIVHPSHGDKVPGNRELIVCNNIKCTGG